MYALILGFITAFSLTYTLIPVIIRVVQARRLSDQPDPVTPGAQAPAFLGGIGIFAGTLCAVVLWIPLNDFGVLQYTLVAFVLVLLAGALDDVLPLRPGHRMGGQALVAGILTYKADLQFDVWQNMTAALGTVPGFAVATALVLFIINAFNLIDGIDGLAGCLGLLSGLLFGAWFYATGNIALAVVAFSAAGAMTAFLKYNFTPAQIYMGDTGSLLTGTICAILSFKFVEINPASRFAFHSAPAPALALMIVPFTDALRVLSGRLLRGQSPFRPDKTHVHHLLLRTGLTHLQSTALLTGVTLAFLLLVCRLDDWGTPILVAGELGLAFLLLKALERYAAHCR